MNVSTTSLQYKMVNFLFRKNGPNENICIYFWQCVLTWLASIASVWAAASTVFVVYVISMGGLQGSMTLMLALAIFPGMLVLVVLGAGTLVLTGLAVGSAICYVLQKINKTTKNPRKVVYESVVAEFIRSKKDRFCKKINFVDEDGKE